MVWQKVSIVKIFKSKMSICAEMQSCGMHLRNDNVNI